MEELHMKKTIFVLIAIIMLVSPVMAKEIDIGESVDYYDKGVQFLINDITKENILLAIPNFEKSVEVNPYFTKGFVMLGYCYSQLYDIDSTNQEYFFRTLENCYIAISIGNQFKEDTSEPYFIAAHTFESRKEYNKAIEFYEYSINSRPDRPDGYIALGNLYYERGNYEEALSAYASALIYGPNDGQTNCRYVELCKNLNKKVDVTQNTKICEAYNKSIQELNKQEQETNQSQITPQQTQTTEQTTTTTTQTTETKNTPGFEIGTVGAAAMLLGYYLKRRK
jgi:tetratricopeptide (TPR) repeat protein